MTVCIFCYNRNFRFFSHIRKNFSAESVGGKEVCEKRRFFHILAFYSEKRCKAGSAQTGRGIFTAGTERDEFG